MMTKPTPVTSADSGSLPAETPAGAPGTAPDGWTAAQVGDGRGRSTPTSKEPEQAGTASPVPAGAPPAPYPDGGLDQGEHAASAVSEEAELPGARALWILAFTFAALGLFFPLAGLIAIGCGAMAWRKGSGRGRIATFVALATTLVGLILTIVVVTT
ncbi:hypothetical protein FRAAL0921 [Frankia alni ACN14a]|uniref:DUF4190 domain-containing protein n=1 Tax=Frankia alni (strain DSM 45986 / CECT 9034 / ACN14a) TaxID=326424 RepID=Q0RS78_FRAAA|nr:hypothetical protein FRAAL0921 [Frankia alni ACN14a]